MKKNKKVILMTLCMGLSINMHGDIEVKNKTIETALKKYDPDTVTTDDPYSLGSAATAWAAGLVSQLTTAERTALAYFALNAPDNSNANDMTVEPVKRIIKQVTQAGVPADKQYIDELAKKYEVTELIPYGWKPAYGIPILSGIVGWWQKPSEAVSYEKEIYWPHVDQYAKKVTAVTGEKKLLASFIPQILEEAKKDMQSKDFKVNVIAKFRLSIEDIQWAVVKDNLSSKIVNIISTDFAAKEAPVITNLEAIVNSEINRSNLEQTFNALKHVEKPITTWDVKQLAQDELLLNDLIQGIKGLTPTKFRILNLSPRLPDDLIKFKQDVAKGIILPSTERTELQEILKEMQAADKAEKIQQKPTVKAPTRPQPRATRTRQPTPRKDLSQMSFKELVTQYGDNRAWSTQARRAALEKRFDSIDQAPAALRNYLIGTANRMRYKKQALIELKALEAE